MANFCNYSANRTELADLKSSARVEYKTAFDALENSAIVIAVTLVLSIIIGLIFIIVTVQLDKVKANREREEAERDRERSRLRSQLLEEQNAKLEKE